MYPKVQICCLACWMRPVGTATCFRHGTCHRAGNVSGDMFSGGGPWLWAQMMCLGDKTHCGTSGEDMQSQGRDAAIGWHPSGFRQPGAIRLTLDTSGDVSEGTDMLFGMSSTFCGCDDASQSQ